MRAMTVALLLAASRSLPAQQVADADFHPTIAQPAYSSGRGPAVALDEAHYNFHTSTGRYQPFAELLRRDGYEVRANSRAFSAEVLRGVRVLVIANALSERNRMNGNATDWSLPTPSAFRPEEIAAVRDWVRGGGSLLLIADHMPFGGCAAELAAAFGVRFSNGFARDTLHPDPLVFRRSDGSLKPSPVLEGRGAGERVDSIATFTGQAFLADSGVAAQPLLVFGASSIALLPDTAWVFHPDTRREAVGGRWQGALLTFGAGRVAFFGEAAMFSAQVTGPARRPMGMNAPIAGQNAQFALNVLHWLSGALQ